MKSILFRLVIGAALALGPVQAMYDAQEEDKGILPQAKVLQQSTSRRETSTLVSFKEEVSFENLPDDSFLSISSFLDIPDFGRISQISTRWQKRIEDPGLWIYMGSRYYGDFLNEEILKEAPKQKAVHHYLSVLVNMTGNLKEIERLVSYYHLDLSPLPFKKYISLSFLTDLITNHAVTHFPSCEELIAQGNKQAIDRKIEGLSKGQNGYEKDPAAAREFIETLIERGNLKAVERKRYGLLHGEYGYENDPTAARELNEFLVGKGGQAAVERKIEGLAIGMDGYERNPVVARELNEALIEKGDLAALKRKRKGLTGGNYGNRQYGYEKDLAAEREVNEILIARGDPEAISRKIGGRYGHRGYDDNSTAANELNEALIEKGDQDAIERKLEALSRGGEISIGSYANSTGYYKSQIPAVGYEKNPLSARELNEALIAKGDTKAIKRKIAALLEGGNVLDDKWGSPPYPTYGYEKNPTAAKEYIKFLITNSPEIIYGMKLPLKEEISEILVGGGNGNAISTKMELLSGTRGILSNKKDPITAREFIENLIMSGMSHVRAIGKYIKAFAMKYGVVELGYEKDPEKAIEFIKHNHVPF